MDNKIFQNHTIPYSDISCSVITQYGCFSFLAVLSIQSMCGSHSYAWVMGIYRSPSYTKTLALVLYRQEIMWVSLPIIVCFKDYVKDQVLLTKHTNFNFTCEAFFTFKSIVSVTTKLTCDLHHHECFKPKHFCWITNILPNNFWVSFLNLLNSPLFF